MGLGQFLNDYAENAPRYNEEGELYKKYGSQWRDYSRAAVARLQTEIDAPARQKVKDEDAHRESLSREKLATAAQAETLAQHARQRLDDATRMLTSQAVINPDGTVTVPDPATLPEEMKQGLSTDSLLRAVGLLQTGLTNDEARRRALAAEKTAAESEKNKRELGESDAQWARRQAAENAESDRRHRRDIADKPRGMTYGQAHAAVMAELSRNRKRATADEIHAMTTNMMENGNPAPASTPAGGGAVDDVPAYLLREGMGRPTDFGSIGKLPGATADPAASGPKVGDVKTFPNGRQGRFDGRGWKPI